MANGFVMYAISLGLKTKGLKQRSFDCRTFPWVAGLSEDVLLISSHSLCNLTSDGS